MTLPERFMSFVCKAEADACWLWGGATAGRYGQFSILGNKAPAHRVAYELFAGSVPTTSLVCHRCDIPLCVNPAHLFLGTASDNMQDMVHKGRHPKQNAQYRAKLSEDDVRAIRASSDTSIALAKIYGVDPTTIRYARSGRNWKNV